MLSKLAVAPVKVKEKRIKNKQCVIYTDEEIQIKRRKVQKQNTIAADKSTGNQLLVYLKQIEANENYWEYSPEQLDDHLSKFWFAARTNKVNTAGEQKKYKIQSLCSLRYGINRNLKLKDYGYDITTSDLFLKSRRAFDDACKELKEEGYGSIKHYPEIAPSG